MIGESTVSFKSNYAASPSGFGSNTLDMVLIVPETVSAHDPSLEVCLTVSHCGRLPGSMWLRICSTQIVGLLHDSQLCRLIRDIVDAASLCVSSPHLPLFDIQECGLKLPTCQRRFVRSAACLPDVRGTARIVHRR